jgi:AcrR family transcriptional regulator
MTETPTDTRTDARARIVDVAAQLLRDEGPGAVTTRGVAALAGVQAPAIYRLFGDKDGLLEAVAEHVMSTFVSAKSAYVSAATDAGVDPLDDLRDGWNSQIAFGVANPALFRLLGDPARVRLSEAAQSGRRVLEARVRRVAASGRLRVSEERAVGMIQAAGTGAIQMILATRPEQQDPGLAEAMYEAVLARILTPAPEPDGPLSPAGQAADALVPAAVALRAAAADLDVLSPGERALLAEWLGRVISPPGRVG